MLVLYTLKFCTNQMLFTIWSILAKACATRFPPLLIKQTLNHCNPCIKWWISSTTLPNNEVFSTKEEMARIILMLSPLIMILENPASTTNSIALRQASNSASSLVHTFGPLAVIAAIASPFSFQIIATYPDLPESKNIAASKFSLYASGGGGCHISSLGCCLIWAFSWV